MTDLLAGPKNMLRWGKKRTAELNTEIEAFAKDKPWTYVIELEPPFTQRYAHKIRFTQRLTEDLPYILFDAANSLRSCLDQAAFAIAAKYTRKPKPTSAKFPFGPDEARMRNDANGRCQDLPAEIRDLFKGFRPYKGGNDTLWGLNELANTPKHMMLVPLFVGGRVSMGNVPGTSLPSVIVQKTWNRERNEIVFQHVEGPGGNRPTNAEFTFAVAFGQIDETLRGKHPVGVLNAMAGEVERVLTDTERVCREIGLTT